MQPVDMVRVPAIVVALNEQQRSGVDGNGIRGRAEEIAGASIQTTTRVKAPTTVCVSVESPSTLFIDT